MQVFLVGFMGAGKSSLGKRLSKRLDLPFIDMDEELEKIEGVSIPNIFETKGEAYFRSLEKKWIQNLSDDAAVISLGGGTPCQDGIMEALREKGVPVFVNVSTGIIVSRLMSANTLRPLIEPFKNDKPKLKNFVEELLNERELYYLRSKIIFECSDVKAEKLDLLADLISLSGS